MIDHLSYAVSDYQKSREFYDATLAPLGLKVVEEFGQAAGYGRDSLPSFWIAAEGDHAKPAAGGWGFHLAFEAEDQDCVNAFYQAALMSGGRDSGAPGLRPDLHTKYYSAFVVDPDGYRIEAVCHRPQS